MTCLSAEPAPLRRTPTGIISTYNTHAIHLAAKAENKAVIEALLLKRAAIKIVNIVRGGHGFIQRAGMDY